MSAPSPAPSLSLALAAAVALCGRPAAADIVPSEAFVSPAPAPWTRPDPEPAGAPDEPGDVVLLEVSAAIDLFPTAALVRASAVVQSPTGGPRRLAIPQFTPWVRAAPITELEVVVDGRPVAPELFDERSRPPTRTKRQAADWWTWPVTLPAGAPVRIDLRYSQALTDPEVRDGRLHLYAFHLAGAAMEQPPIRSLEFSLRLHGIAADAVRPTPAPTAATADELVWRRKDVAPADARLGVTAELPVAGLPGRDVTRAPYFPADAPAHVVVQDYVVRFAVDCSPPTPDQWERLVDLLRETAGRSASPLARSWAAGTLRDVGRWCHPAFNDPSVDEPDEPTVGSPTWQCQQWLAVAAPTPGSSPDTLARPLWCWGESGAAEANLERAAERARRRRLALWAGGSAVAVLAAAVLLWKRRRR